MNCLLKNMNILAVAAVAATVCIALTAAWSATVRFSGIDPLDGPQAAVTQAPLQLVPVSSFDKVQVLAKGQVQGTEDMVFTANDEIFTATADGWIKRVVLISGSGEAQNWSFVGGRPLGIAAGVNSGEFIVCEPYQGLLSVNREGFRVLTNSYAGSPMSFVDGVDIRKEDGMIYFSDASWKYGIHNWIFDILEGRPNGRLFQYNPNTNSTELILDNLFFTNGVVLSPSTDFVIFCESSAFRCSKYWVHGSNKGKVEIFVENLPGFPDNIRLGTDGHYWIAMFSIRDSIWKLALSSKYTRYAFAALCRFSLQTCANILLGKSGVVNVDLQGRILGFYGGKSNKQTGMVTFGTRHGDYLYLGNIDFDAITRIPLPATFSQ